MNTEQKRSFVPKRDSLSLPRDKIKVVHIITRLILGGAQENTILTVEGLKRHPDFDVVLVAGPALGPEGELEKRVRDNNIELIIIPQLRRNINPLYDFIALIRLFFLLLKLKPDIVHTHSAKAGILGRFAAWLAGVKCIIHTLHGLSFHPYQNKIVNWLYIWAEKTGSWFTDKFICVADAMSQQSIAAGIGKPQDYVTIYSALELENFTPLKKLSDGKKKNDKDNTQNNGTFLTGRGVKETPEQAKKELGLEGKKIVGTIARIAPLKGHNYILEIADRVIREVPDVRFMFVGDGSLFDKMKREVQGRGIEKWFVFTGLVPPERIPFMIQAIDVLVHPSLREGLARTIPQSFSLGKPVISFDVDGAKELVKNQQTGFLIPPPNLYENTEETTKKALEELTQSIIWILKNSDKAQEMGKNGQKLIYPNFDANYMVKRIIEVYNSEYKLLI